MWRVFLICYSFATLILEKDVDLSILGGNFLATGSGVSNGGSGNCPR
jgi:hypothetical protein